MKKACKNCLLEYYTKDKFYCNYCLDYFTKVLGLNQLDLYEEIYKYEEMYRNKDCDKKHENNQEIVQSLKVISDKYIDNFSEDCTPEFLQSLIINLKI